MIDIETKSLDGDLPFACYDLVGLRAHVCEGRNCFGDGFACAVDVEDWHKDAGRENKSIYKYWGCKALAVQGNLILLKFIGICGLFSNFNIPCLLNKIK